MRARPYTIATMPFADRFATRAVLNSATSGVLARCGLCRERLARCLDGAETMLAASLGHARVTVPAPSLKHWLAAHRASDGIARLTFNGWSSPFARQVRPRLRGPTRRFEQR